MEDKDSHGTDDHMNYIQSSTRPINNWYDVFRFLWKINYDGWEVQDLMNIYYKLTLLHASMVS